MMDAAQSIGDPEAIDVDWMGHTWTVTRTWAVRDDMPRLPVVESDCDDGPPTRHQALALLYRARESWRALPPRRYDARLLPVLERADHACLFDSELTTAAVLWRGGELVAVVAPHGRLYDGGVLWEAP